MPVKVPNVITREVDVFPAQWGQMPNQIIADGLVSFAEHFECAIQVNGTAFSYFHR